MEHDEIYDKVCNPRLERIEHQVTNDIPHRFGWVIGLILGSWFSTLGIVLLILRLFTR